MCTFISHETHIGQICFSYFVELAGIDIEMFKSAWGIFLGCEKVCRNDIWHRKSSTEIDAKWQKLVDLH